MTSFLMKPLEYERVCDACGDVRVGILVLNFSREFSRVWHLFLKTEYFKALITEDSLLISDTVIYSACGFIRFA